MVFDYPDTQAKESRSIKFSYLGESIACYTSMLLTAP